MNMPGPSGMHQVANQDPNYGKFIKSTIWSHPFWTFLKPQTSILPSFPKDSDLSLLRWMHETLVPLITLTSFVSYPSLITRRAATYYGAASQWLFYNFPLLWRILHGGDINSFHTTQLLSHSETELYLPLPSSAVWDSRFRRRLLSLKNCASVKSNFASLLAVPSKFSGSGIEFVNLKLSKIILITHYVSM